MQTSGFPFFRALFCYNNCEPRWSAKADKLIGRLARRRRARCKKVFYLYILKSVKTKLFYKGITNSLERRINQHSSGKVNSTKRFLPLELIYVELCSSRKEAREFEVFFKSGQGREIIQELFN